MKDPRTLLDFSGKTILKRVAAPEEIIGPALYLAGPASSYTTGTVLVTDGGFLVNN